MDKDSRNTTETFAKIKAMELPRSVVVGHDAIYDIGKICKRLGLHGHALIVSDDITKKIAGELVEDCLKKENYEVQHALISDATVEEMNRVKEHTQEIKANFVLGVGGGRPIDIAKCASKEHEIPFISVPTAASHDGIVSSHASIRIKGVNESIAAHSPLAVIADTKIIAQSPYRLLAAGCGDIIAKLTAVKDWVLAKKIRNEYYSSYASSLSEMTAMLLIESADTIKPSLEESARFVVKALVSSGVAMSIAGSSRPASGSEHKFSHALDRIAEKPGLHGEQCGVGTIMMMYLHGGDWQKIKLTLSTIGAPTTAKELGVSREEIIAALTHAHEIRPERYTILGDSGLSPEAAEKLATITEVI